VRRIAVTQTFAFDDLKRLLEHRVGLSQEEVGDDPDRRFDEMDLDSLAFEEVQLALEDAYGFTITYEEAQTIATLNDAIDYTNRKIAERG
jgi:acyl carrier protein